MLKISIHYLIEEKDLSNPRATTRFMIISKAHIAIVSFTLTLTMYAFLFIGYNNALVPRSYKSSYQAQ